MSVYKKCTVALSLCRFWNFDTFLQKVKNVHYYWSFFWHFDTPDKTRNYQKDRKRQSDKSFKVSKYHVIWYFPKLGLTLAATPASPFLASMPAHLCAIQITSPTRSVSPIWKFAWRYWQFWRYRQYRHFRQCIFFFRLLRRNAISTSLLIFNTPREGRIVSDKLVIRWIFVSHYTTHYVP